jgi:hypothetical protein
VLRSCTEGPEEPLAGTTSRSQQLSCEMSFSVADIFEVHSANSSHSPGLGAFLRVYVPTGA